MVKSLVIFPGTGWATPLSHVRERVSRPRLPNRLVTTGRPRNSGLRRRRAAGSVRTVVMPLGTTPRRGVGRA